MLVYAKIESLQQKLGALKNTKQIGFVPTMGALHEGHLSLVRQAKDQNQVVVVSIFVNPTQFDKPEDLVNYPKSVEQDLSLLKSVGCDIVFTPNAKEMYQNNLSSEKFDFDGLENEMEGKFREGHFDGVGTVVKKFFDVVKPNRAYFGEKDFQQLQIIKKMVQNLQLDVEIIAGSIYREKDGLAMSSRNARLTKEQRIASPFIYKTLKHVKNNFGTKDVQDIAQWVDNEFKNQSELKLEYFQIADETTLKPVAKMIPGHEYRAFLAVFAGKIRLIDNINL